MLTREKTATIYLLPSFLAIFYLCIGAYIAHPYMHHHHEDHHHEHHIGHSASCSHHTFSPTGKLLEAPSSPSHNCLICSFLKANNSALVHSDPLVHQPYTPFLSHYHYLEGLYNKCNTTPYARGPPAVRIS